MDPTDPLAAPPRMTKANVVVAFIAGFTLAFSALWFVYIEVWLFGFGAGDKTCMGGRRELHVGPVVAVSTVGYLVVIAPAIWLLTKKETPYAILALLNALFALVEPCLGAFWVIGSSFFQSGMY